jgi:hypothetical protein
MTAAKIMSSNSDSSIENSSTRPSLTIPSTSSLEIHINLDDKTQIPTPIYDEMILQAREERLLGPLFNLDIPIITIEEFDSEPRRQTPEYGEEERQRWIKNK